jgi:redox-sensitive bicupin YhaK (pirin superfamily)
MLWSDTIPTVQIKDGNGKSTAVRVVAGKIGDTQAPDPAPNSWAANPENEVAIWTIKMESGAQWTLHKASAQANRSLYFYDGKSVQIEDKHLSTHQAVELKADHDVTLVNGEAESYLLLLQGKPINEPVAQYGPFVMNSQAEIQQAYMEFQQTQFGGWPWPSYEHVHPREKGRFAKYPDGKLEERG